MGDERHTKTKAILRDVNAGQMDRAMFSRLPCNRLQHDSTGATCSFLESLQCWMLNEWILCVSSEDICYTVQLPSIDEDWVVENCTFIVMA
jgi:hypothetical protein